MKWFIRFFFRTLRRILGPFILLIDALTKPKGMVRSPDAQQQLDRLTQRMALYQFRTCPFSVKTRREIQRLSLKIELLDAQHYPQHREALLQGGGKIKVPCLSISEDDGNTIWMYESNDIIQYLRQLAGVQA